MEAWRAQCCLGGNPPPSLIRTSRSQVLHAYLPLGEVSPSASKSKPRRIASHFIHCIFLPLASIQKNCVKKYQSQVFRALISLVFGAGVLRKIPGHLDDSHGDYSAFLVYSLFFMPSDTTPKSRSITFEQIDPKTI